MIVKNVADVNNRSVKHRLVTCLSSSRAVIGYSSIGEDGPFTANGHLEEAVMSDRVSDVQEAVPTVGLMKCRIAAASLYSLFP